VLIAGKVMTTPNPGTEEAIKQGCKCPVLDNHHGRGVLMGKDPKPQFGTRQIVRFTIQKKH
jgi:hypothetical protein